MSYKNKKSKPGLYYGTDGLIYDKKTKQWIEDPKTFNRNHLRVKKNKNKNRKSISIDV